MATVKLDPEYQQPDFDEAQDVSYDEGSQDTDFDARQAEYDDAFQDEGGDNVSQEWQGRRK
ncbi:hypothetical protein HER32_12065 [Hymenobacter sp. BT18]|uniref:hypothetical protein n=1 Tax=Hymenobacter sp. BT18 TaxID=2835648 RepID=UPI00143E8654|nr:hypothetical protein [Hymenobacter sp. BT18]QIX61878.1 hypothetical protein HER32_12065 [Hymenobacter sp. BT18]